MKNRSTKNNTPNLSRGEEKMIKSFSLMVKIRSIEVG